MIKRVFGRSHYKQKELFSSCKCMFFFHHFKTVLVPKNNFHFIIILNKMKIIVFHQDLILSVINVIQQRITANCDSALVHI